MNQNIVTYLNENKEKYPKDVLVAELRKSGYTEEEITEGVAQVFEGKALAAANTSFWNFKDKKVYASAGQKWADFLFGVFVHIFITFISFFFLGHFFYIVLFILLAVCLHKYRRYMFYGMIATFVLLLIGPLFLIFNGNGF